MIQEKHKHIIFLILTAGIIVFLGNLAYDIQTNQHTLSIKQYLVNFPTIVLFTFVDLLIVKYFTNTFKYKHKIFVRGLLELLITSAFAGIATIGLNSLLQFILREPQMPLHDHMQNVINVIQVNVIIVLLIELFLHYQRQVAIEKEKMQYRYDVLKAQVNPHFLFNSLNVLSSLAYEDPEKTNLFAKKLSNIYRYVLSASSLQTVSLSEELAFIQSYIFLEQIRFGNAIVFKIENTADVNGQIIPVSLQLLVENATKHNIATSTQPLTIRIQVDNKGVSVSNNLQLRYSVDKEGYGLYYLQKQYELFNKHIEVQTTDNEFIVRIPFI